MNDSLPHSTHRLFAHYRDRDLLAEENLDFVIGRLLEEGNGDDLRWLTTVVTEPELARWLALRGDRQLSRRSRCFWELTLETSSREASLGSIQTWPL